MQAGRWRRPRDLPAMAQPPYTFPPPHAGYFAAPPPVPPPHPPPFPGAYSYPPPPPAWHHHAPYPFPPPYPPPPYPSCPPPQPAAAGRAAEPAVGGEAEMEIESQEKIGATRGVTLDAKTIELLGPGWEKRSKDRAG